MSKSLLEWFFIYQSKDVEGGFDIRDISNWYLEPTGSEKGYRVYTKDGKSHWITCIQLSDLLLKMSLING